VPFSPIDMHSATTVLGGNGQIAVGPYCFGIQAGWDTEQAAGPELPFPFHTNSPLPSRRYNSFSSHPSPPRLQVPVCISQLLAHILFLTANGGSSSSSEQQQHPEDPHAHPLGNTSSSSSSSSSNTNSSSRRFVGGTALPDTFTTPYFVLLSSVARPPPEFIADMAERWGVEVEAGAKVFDLFR